MRCHHEWRVLVFHHGELLVETWNDGLGSVGAEIAASKARVDNPADPATHMDVIGKPLPAQPWADLTGYTEPRPGKPTPREARERRRQQPDDRPWRLTRVRR